MERMTEPVQRTARRKILRFESLSLVRGNRLKQHLPGYWIPLLRIILLPPPIFTSA